ncbi:MAG: hypothetical protein AAGI38_22735 [Bacteroidota bacterium]
MQDYLPYLPEALALLLAVGAIWQNVRLRKEVRQLKSKEISLAPEKPGHFPRPKLVYQPNGQSDTHRIHQQRLVNSLCLTFKNTGATLYYDDVIFEQHNAHQEVEILAEEGMPSLPIPGFEDNEDQKVAHGDQLRVVFDREIGISMAYRFAIRYMSKNGKFYYQLVEGKPGEVPDLGPPKLIDG